MDYFHNKKILITQSALHFLAGSEITTLELATFFQQNGASVLVFTWYLESPMKDEFEKRKIPVTTNEEDDRLNEIDIAWIHHQVIPEKILATLKNTKHPQFFFFHMSPLSYVPIEHPYLNDIENKIANKVLFSSKGTKDSLLSLFPSLTNKSDILENLLPDSFCMKRRNPTQPKNILIVSNHPPEELTKASRILTKHHFNVNCIGQDGKVELITIDILKQYDLVIAIGKTVVYCLGANIPIYVYDHFGGPGFLSEKNFEKTRYRTFSGRDFNKKTPQKIVEEILNNYLKSTEYQSKYLERFQNDFSTQKQFKRLFQNINDIQIPPLTIEHYNSLQSTLQLIKARIVAENVLWNTAKTHSNTIKTLHQLELSHHKLMDDYTILTKKYNKLSEEHFAIVNSKRYKLLNKISRIAHLGK